MSPTIRTIDINPGTRAYFAAATVTEARKLIHISGQVGTKQDGKAPEDYESQIHLALLKLRSILLAAGARVQDILKITQYIVNYDAARRLHTKPIQHFLGSHRPACTLVPVQQLASPGLLFEIEAVVAKHNTQTPPIGRTLSAHPPVENVDVVVIGAGLAGLSTAHEVLKAGYSCVVLEARDRVGGRTFSKTLPGGYGVIDMGAAWINDTNQSRMFTLARRFKLELIKQNVAGDCSIQDDAGKIDAFAYGDLPHFDEATRQNVAFIRDTVEADCQTVDCANPKDSDLDSVTFAAYLRGKGATETALKTATVWTRAMLGREPEDVSALFFLNYCKSGGGLLQMRSDGKHGGQYLRVRQGTQSFAKGLANELPTGVLRLSTPVTSVWQPGYQNAYVQAGDRTYTARKVISTIPYPVLNSMIFEPPLPLAKQVLINSYGYGYYQKVMAVFKTPFWVEKGYCGLVQSFIGPASVIRDTSSPSDNKWILTCFVAGVPGREWASLPRADAGTALLQQIAEVFCEPDAANQLVEFVGFQWEDERFSGYGCPSPSLPPGVLDSAGGALRESFGNVHFAGTETAVKWKGYMEGAVRSGERAAKEVDLALTNIAAKL